MAAGSAWAAAAPFRDPLCMDMPLFDWSLARAEPCWRQRGAKFDHTSESHATRVCVPAASVQSRRRAFLHVAHHLSPQALRWRTPGHTPLNRLLSPFKILRTVSQEGMSVKRRPIRTRASSPSWTGGSESSVWYDFDVW